MKRFVKKSCTLAVAMMMTFTVAACSSKEEPADSTNAQSSNEATTTEAKTTKDSEGLNDEDYAEKVAELYLAIQTDSASAMEGIDQTNMEQMVNATKNMVTTVKPYYEELAGLETSGQYKEAQEQIKTGAEASSKMLDLSLELMNLGMNPDDTTEEELQKKTEEFQTQITTLATDAQMLTTGITTVLEGTEAPAE